jgi:hypothetical protein
MIGERELVALLYRVDWTRLSPSGEVYGGNERLLSMVTFIQAHRATRPITRRSDTNVLRLGVRGGRRQPGRAGQPRRGGAGRRGPRHIEYPIHTEIMAARPDVGAVVHTHSPTACAFAALDVPLRPLDHAGSLFCYPDIPRFTLTAMAAGPLRRWGAEADTVAKRADVWSATQLRAGYEYLLRQAR